MKVNDVTGMTRHHELAIKIADELREAVTKARDDCVLLAFYQTPDIKDGAATEQANIDIANMLREYIEQLDPVKEE